VRLDFSREMDRFEEMARPSLNTGTAIRHWISGLTSPRRIHAEIIQRLARERNHAHDGRDLRARR
jgi:hypothetical protein